LLFYAPQSSGDLLLGRCGKDAPERFERQAQIGLNPKWQKFGDLDERYPFFSVLARDLKGALYV
jgi:hypothetical protein